MSARLRKSTLAFFDMQQKHSDPEDVDLAHAGLYLVGAQVIARVLLLSFTATACSWLQPASQVSAVRSLAATTVLAMLMLEGAAARGVDPRRRRPLQCPAPLRLCLSDLHGRRAAAALVRDAHRRNPGAHDRAADCLPRRQPRHDWAALLRASAPTSENDLWFLITLGALLVIAVVPPPSLSTTGLLRPADRVGFRRAHPARRALLGGVRHLRLCEAAAAMTCTTLQSL